MKEPLHQALTSDPPFLHEKPTPAAADAHKEEVPSLNRYSMESGIDESRRDFLSDKLSTSLEGGELGPKLTMRDFFQIRFCHSKPLLLPG